MATSTKREVRRLVVENIPGHVLREFKAACCLSGETMREVIIRMMTQKVTEKK